MIETIKNLYYTNDLNGEALVRPLKNFNHYIASDKGLLWRIAQVVEGVFVYPFLAILAVLGLAVKMGELLMYPHVIKNHNEVERSYVDHVRRSLQMCAAPRETPRRPNEEGVIAWVRRTLFGETVSPIGQTVPPKPHVSFDHFSSSSGPNIECITHDTFSMSAENAGDVSQQIKDRIQKYTQAFRKVYMKVEGSDPIVHIYLKTVEPKY